MYSVLRCEVRRRSDWRRQWPSRGRLTYNNDPLLDQCSHRCHRLSEDVDGRTEVDRDAGCLLAVFVRSKTCWSVFSLDWKRGFLNPSRDCHVGVVGTCNVREDVKY